MSVVDWWPGRACWSALVVVCWLARAGKYWWALVYSWAPDEAYLLGGAYWLVRDGAYW